MWGQHQMTSKNHFQLDFEFNKKGDGWFKFYNGQTQISDWTNQTRAIFVFTKSKLDSV